MAQKPPPAAHRPGVAHPTSGGPASRFVDRRGLGSSVTRATDVPATSVPPVSESHAPQTHPRQKRSRGWTLQTLRAVYVVSDTIGAAPGSATGTAAQPSRKDSVAPLPVGGLQQSTSASMTAVPPRHDAGSRICPECTPTREPRRSAHAAQSATACRDPPSDRPHPAARLSAGEAGGLPSCPTRRTRCGPAGPSDASSAVRALRGVGRPVGRVLSRSCGGDHPSATTVAGRLVRSTRMLGRAALERILSDLAPGGVCLAAPVARRTGGLLHHRFTLTGPRTGGLFSVALIPRVAPGGCWPPPCPVEPGPSSTRHRSGEPRPPGRPTRGGV